MSDAPNIVLFRDDLRLADQPALSAALARGQALVCAYVLDDDAPGPWKLGGASRWWLHHSLASLRSSFQELGGRLVLRRGSTIEILTDLVTETGAQTVYTSRAFEPWAVRLENELKDELAKNGARLRRFAGRLLHDPDKLLTGSGSHYKVYTPFWRSLAKSAVRRPIDAPRSLKQAATDIASADLDDWALRPSEPDWARGFPTTWSPGENGARARLHDFLDQQIVAYDEARDRPDLEATSRLSPHLRFGEISPAVCWHAALALAEREPDKHPGAEKFLKELAWREFSYHLLYHYPELPVAPYRAEFERFRWAEDDNQLRCWQTGSTGYPIVDAGMRELWATGWMHNRVRMIVASFLTKDLLLPWQAGKRWFWDCLVDADLASNAASWQWVAGCGADAAPYFRIFNPVTQSKKFDPDARYIKNWVPELSALPADLVHAPWEVDTDELYRAGITLGKDYPGPVVNHAEARKKALLLYDELK
jgi:deoxyribodipyrimidine photo-lyase